MRNSFRGPRLRISPRHFVRLATANKHVLVYHPASIDDIQEDKDEARRAQTLQRLRQYTKLEHRPACPWNTPDTKRNDAADNEILYALSLHAASALVTEDGTDGFTDLLDLDLPRILGERLAEVVRDVLP